MKRILPSDMRSLPFILCTLGLIQMVYAGEVGIQPNQPSINIDDIVVLHGNEGAGNLWPTVARPYGLVSIGSDIKRGVASFSCTHLHGTGGDGWNYFAPTFVLTTGPINTDPATWRATYKDYSLFEARADGLRMESKSLGYTIEIVATLRGAVVVAKSIGDKPLNLLFPLHGTPNNGGGQYALTQRDDRWCIEGFQTTGRGGKGVSGTTVFGSFVCDGAKETGTWTKEVLTHGPGLVIGKSPDPRVGVYLTIPPGKELRMRLGLSFTDVEGASRNLAAEVPKADTDRIRAETSAEWQAQLDLIRVDGGTPSQRRMFTTALYRSFQAPHVFEDVDGRYLDFRSQVRTIAAPRQHLYATYSGWDTFRTQMPLIALVDPKRYSDMCNSMLEMETLPRWPLANHPGRTMCGAPLQQMLASGRYHEIAGVDWTRTLELMKKTLKGQLASKGILGNDYNGTAAVAVLAAALGDRSTTETWWAKTIDYRTFFDAQKQLFPASNQEGSPLSYVFYNGMWDPEGLAQVLGGRANAVNKLRDFMLHGAEFYNENDIHLPFLATLWGEPELTAAKLPGIINNMAKDVFPGGRAGNDDMGTMSAWLVLAQIGIYPIHPAAGIYVPCPPSFSQVVINPQRGGQSLTITSGMPLLPVQNAPPSPRNRSQPLNVGAPSITIIKATLNETLLERPWLLARELVRGGRLDFVCGPPPSTWCRSPKPMPTPVEMLSQTQR